MKKKLLDYLVCPDCCYKFELSISKAENDEIMEGTLICLGCYNKYSITGGIPRILKDNQDRISKRTAKNFGYSWSNVWKLNSIDEIEFNSYFSGLLEKEDFKDKIILDVGCGNGRFTYFAGKYATKDVIGFDSSNSIEVAFENTRNLKNVHIVQADIYNLPFKRQYDFIYSIGVLHHLPEPEEGFKKLVNLLAKDGKIFVWVYGKEGNKLYLSLFEPFRILTSRLPLFINKMLAIILARIIWIIVKLFYLPLDKRGCVDKLPLGKYLIFFYRLGLKQLTGTVFDKMIPPISNYYAEQEFKAWFKNHDLKDIKILERNTNSWRGLGRKEVLI